eukprot:CAMPEP_0198305124 /NCGR_PEP_ID=MMETSP1449-20131203/57748_1 /TAXON_ID=420275 /ORGANISM="Attheya septentrionalis, Strain CCMP2084" /LENGTH=250 /DNA_ID=CAMNT_0044007655 /DNA_START=545 /DNA_END=1294 /DNA_ORIENTATION=+
MRSVVRCILRNCLDFEETNDTDEAHHCTHEEYNPPVPVNMGLGLSDNQEPPDDDPLAAPVCQDTAVNCENSQNEVVSNPSHPGMFSKWFGRTRYESIEQEGESPPPPESSLEDATPTISIFPGRRGLLFRLSPSSKVQPCDTTATAAAAKKEDTIDPIIAAAVYSPSLKAAETFKSCGGTPSISLNEVVMPGSELQLRMAKTMQENLDCCTEDECVICMEGFDPTNPRMPTICGCGENKTFFHLPCLYQW